MRHHSGAVESIVMHCDNTVEHYNPTVEHCETTVEHFDTTIEYVTSQLCKIHHSGAL